MEIIQPLHMASAKYYDKRIQLAYQCQLEPRCQSQDQIMHTKKIGKTIGTSMYNSLPGHYFEEYKS